MNSAVGHLKDMIKLGKIHDKELGKQNDIRILDYVEENIE